MRLLIGFRLPRVERSRMSAEPYPPSEPLDELETILLAWIQVEGKSLARRQLVNDHLFPRSGPDYPNELSYKLKVFDRLVAERGW